MARSGLVKLTDAVFEKDGKQIPYRKAHLTRDAEDVDEDTPLELAIRHAVAAAKTTKGKRQRKAKGAVSKRTIREKKATPAEPMQNAGLEAALRAWRAGQAKRQGVPAFRVLSDRVLLGIAQNQPRSAAELLAIPGIGIASVSKYGAQIYRILNRSRK
jgi:superfamily II DNA helicase RecQ